MSNYLEYQKSIAQEFEALENRVRNLIDTSNWAEEGRYKEVLVMNYLKRILPKNISVGTGFVKSHEKISTQIDIIIYDNSCPILFREGEFVVVLPESVLGIIEVKSNIKASEIVEIINKANANCKMILDGDNGGRNIFNGIFSYNIINRINAYEQNIKAISPMNPIDENSFVNNISLGKNFFIRYWESRTYPTNKAFSYCVYGFSKSPVEGLSFAYFFSNLLYTIYKYGEEGNRAISSEFENFLFPIPNGKDYYELYKIFMGENQN